MNAYLYLEDGSVFVGQAFGAVKETLSELVFNTGMTGYQEVLTDPSYRGQTVLMTYPLIGNYGINDRDFESDAVQVEGFIVREYSEHPSHYLCRENLDSFLRSQGVPGICGLDTRMLTKKIRDQGAMKCLIAYEETPHAQDVLQSFAMPTDVACRGGISEKQVMEGSGVRVGLLDVGCKRGIAKQLLRNGCTVIFYPYWTTREEIEEDKLDALLLSNGPGDPKDCRHVTQLALGLLGKLPLWGICLGHQILALALGADTYKMKFGHRGSNHPVLRLDNNQVLISSQNHGYAVDEASLGPKLHLTYRNINDGTVEGFDCPEYRVRTVQFHPEEGPGPVDGHAIIHEWIQSMKEEMRHAEK